MDKEDTKGRHSALAAGIREPLAGAIGLDDQPITVLVVEDEALNRRLLRRYLTRAGMIVLEAEDGAVALDLLRGPAHAVDVVVLDMLMPRVSGPETMAALRDDDRFARLPVLVTTNLGSIDAQEEMFGLGASDYLHKPVRPRELVARVRNLARLKRGLEHLDDAERVILSLARMVEAKDDNTEGHCERLSVLSVALGRHLGLDDRQLVALDRGGVLHDIGKVGIPDSVLFKTGPLSVDEWEIMKQHPVIGEQVVAPLRTLQVVRPIIRHHHERWDGSGYPDGLAGDAIPLSARVLQVVDAYDALRTRRPYKKALSHTQAAELLHMEASQGLWDTELLGEALSMFRSYRLPVGISW